MSVTITVTGKKGHVPLLLKKRVEEVLEQAGDQLDAELRSVIESLQSGANKVVFQAPRGHVLDVQIHVLPGPLGSWSGSVCVNSRRPFRRRN